MWTWVVEILQRQIYHPPVPYKLTTSGKEEEVWNPRLALQSDEKQTNEQQQKKQPQLFGSLQKAGIILHL